MSSSPEQVMADQSAALAEAVAGHLAGWVERSVALRAPGPGLRSAAAEAGRRAAVEVGAEVRALLARDPDEQPVNPLALLRAAVRYPTAVLRDAGVAEVERDDFRRQRFPDDVYDLAPATWSDIDPALLGPGIAWGAARALLHRARHAS